MEPYPPEVELAMKSFFRSLREHDRRRYAAVEAAKLGHGGIEYISQLLDIAPNTIRQGRRDLEGLPDRPQPRVRRPGGGRKRRIDREPEVEEDFHDVLRDHTAGSPTDEHLIWTDLTVQEISERMAERGSDVNVQVVDQLLDRYGYHRRQAQRARPLGAHPDRDAQFEDIARLKREFLDGPDPILSIDTKARELIGNYYRKGTLLTRETIETFDHDFPRDDTTIVLPRGLYDLKLNRGYVHLGTSHDTSEFACDCLSDWWGRFGRELYPEARTILLLCDGGGSNPADNSNGVAHVFKAELQRLADAVGLELRVAHYPPYTSKYNPIEHRLFCHLTRACRGVILRSVDLCAEQMRKAKTRTGLSVVVDIVEKVYQIGAKVSEAAKGAIRIIRDEVLPTWNYRILPNL
jgi:Rhodopirellula transposase DDE domain